MLRKPIYLMAVGILFLLYSPSFSYQTIESAGDRNNNYPSETNTQSPPRLYRLVEGSWLIDDCLYCDRPTIIIPIRGCFWLQKTNTDPLYDHFQIHHLKLKSVSSYFSYRGNMDGTYRIGGEVAYVNQVGLQGSINN